jgi:DNA-binding CsgD family transcriptional regulator
MKSNALRRSLPAGINDSGTEFIGVGKEPWEGGEPKAFHNGNLLRYSEFPEYLKEIIHQDKLKKEGALESLIDWGFSDVDSQNMQFILCTRSMLDNKADIDTDGILGESEYVFCSKRPICKYVGKICRITLPLDFGDLTPREIEITAKIGEDLHDKQICSDLGIKQPTLRTHKDHVRIKGGLKSKAGIAIIAHNYKLIKSW